MFDKRHLVRDMLAKTKGESDSDWSEIAEKHHIGCTSSHLRKMAKGQALAEEAGYLDLGGHPGRPDAAAPPVEAGQEEYFREQTDSLRREKQKFFDQRREYNKILMAEAREENLYDRLSDAAEKLNAFRPMRGGDCPVPGGVRREAVLFLSDWHYGMVADNIWNHYDKEVASERLEWLCNEAIEQMRVYKPSVLHVVILGDMCNGGIHTSTRVASEELVCDQLMQVSEIIAQLVDVLSKHVPHTHVHATYGNHMRTIQNQQDSIRGDNFERVIPWWLKQRLSDNPSVDVHEGGYYEFVRLDVCGRHLCGTHGDVDKVKNFGLLVNTIFQKEFGHGIDYAFSGHIHHIEAFESLGVESFVVGSLCGTDEYANNKRLYATPSQTLVIFREDIGRESVCNIMFPRKNVDHSIA